MFDQCLYFSHPSAVSINLFDYMAAILSYFIVAIPIMGGRYGNASSSDISSIISKVKIYF